MTPGKLNVVMLASVPFPPDEGLGLYVMALARRLVANGHRVTILTRGGVRSRLVMNEGRLQIIGVPFVPAYPIHVHLHGPFIRRALTRIRPAADIIHAHSPLPPDPGRSAAPLITTLHSALRRDTRSTTITNRHSLATWLQTPVAAQIEASLIHRSRIVAVVDGSVEGYVRDIDPVAGISVVGNAVDVDQIRPGLARRSRDVLYVGRLAPAKGLEDLMQAWPRVVAAMPDARLVVVGDGPLLGRLRAHVSASGIEPAVLFTGNLGADRRTEVIDAYRRAALVVQPSHHEGLSTVVLEAMSAATPIVATAVGAHSTVIQSGVNGVLVPPRNPRMLGDSITELLASPEAARTMGLRGRRTVVAGYSWDTLAHRYEELYAQAVAAGPRS
jgi:glycosyltransferase involved in cell wall biosynthesis